MSATEPTAVIDTASTVGKAADYFGAKLQSTPKNEKVDHGPTAVANSIFLPSMLKNGTLGNDQFRDAIKIENALLEDETATSKTNHWKRAAIAFGILAIISLVALAALFIPPVGAAVGGALLLAQIGTGAGAALFGALSIGFGVKAHLFNKA